MPSIEVRDSFVVKLDPAYPANLLDRYVLLSDVNGNVLAAGPFEPGDSIRFDCKKDSLKDNLVNVSFFSKSVLPPFESRQISCYMANPVNQNWTVSEIYKYGPENTGQKTGDFSITINNIPTDHNFYLTRADRPITGTSGNYNSVEKTRSISTDVFSDARNYLLLVREPASVPKFAFFSNVDPGSTYEVDYGSMKNPNEIRIVNFPETSLSQYSVATAKEKNWSYTGYLLDAGFLRSQSESNSPTSKISLSYLDTFSIYNTYVEAYYPSTSFGYFNYGPAPEEVALPLSANIVLNDSSIRNFDFTASDEVVRRRSRWRWTEAPAGTKDFYFEVVAPGNSKPIFPTIPDEILQKYPDFPALEDFGYRYTEFYLTGRSYQEWIEFYLLGKKKEDYFKETWISK